MVGIYWTFAAAAGALLVASVVRALLFAPPAAASATTVTECRAQIGLQLRRLDARVAGTMAAILDPDAAGSALEREDWSRIERKHAQLRGSCLAAAGKGATAEAMTEALDALGEVERGYRDLLELYHRDVAADRHRLRQLLAELGRDVSSAAGDPR